MQPTKIVIIGGGFAGTKCAETLRSKLPSSYEITLFSEENHMVFHPLLAEVATAKVSPTDITAVLRELVKGVRCRTEEVTNIDLKNNQIEYSGYDSAPRFMPYDHLVIACGNTSNLAVVPGMADHAVPLKTIADALSLRTRVIDCLEKAEVCDDIDRKRWYLSFVVVGGGFSGVEVAGELNDLLREASKVYSNFTADDIKVSLVHSHDQILQEVSSSLRIFAQSKMTSNGVRFLLNSQAAHCTNQGLELKDGRFLSAATVVCTIGSRMLPMLERLDVRKERGRIVANPDMSVPGTTNVWAVGDCAAVVNALNNKLSPTTGQFAERQGTQVAHNIIAKLAGSPTKPFAHKSLGMLCSIGGRSAVAELPGGIKISGFISWFFWRAVYLAKLPSLSQQFGVGASWFLDLLFPPALASLRVDQLRHVGRAHYTPGDFVFKEGDPACDFYVIEEGQVEIIGSDGSGDRLILLGRGDFFGEEAIVQGGKRQHHCRAVGNAEIMVFGKEIFTEMTAHLTPLKHAIASALTRRNSLWQTQPEARGVVQDIPLMSLVEPLDGRMLNPEAIVREVIDTVNDNRFDVCFVADEQRHLLGIVTRSDLMRSIETAASSSPEDYLQHVRVRDIMVPSPLKVSAEDSTWSAVASMREHGFTRLPVVDSSTNNVLKGYLRIEHIMQSIAKKLLGNKAA